MSGPVKNSSYYLNIATKARTDVLAAIMRKDYDASSKAAQAAIQAEDNARNAEKKEKLEKLKSQYHQQTVLMLSYARKCKADDIDKTIQSLKAYILKVYITGENKETMLSNLNEYIRTDITPILKECSYRPPRKGLPTHKHYVAPPSSGGRRTRRVKRGRKGTRRQ